MGRDGRSGNRNPAMERASCRCLVMSAAHHTRKRDKLNWSTTKSDGVCLFEAAGKKPEIGVHLPFGHDFLQGLEHRFAFCKREAERLWCQVLPFHTGNLPRCLFHKFATSEEAERLEGLGA